MEDIIFDIRHAARGVIKKGMEEVRGVEWERETFRVVRGRVIGGEIDEGGEGLAILRRVVRRVVILFINNDI